MGKLLISLEKQLKTEHKKDAEDCLVIYNTLMDRTGHVWESNWNRLVSVTFSGGYPGKRTYKPTSIGEIFLKGLKE